ARKLFEMEIESEDDCPDAPGATSDHRIGQRNGFAASIQLPQGLLYIVPKPIIGGNIDGHIPKVAEFLAKIGFAKPASDFGSNYPAHRHFLGGGRQRQRAQRITAFAQQSNVIAAINENGAYGHNESAFPVVAFS